MKKFIKYYKKNPREFVENVLFVCILSLLFYISMWIFY